MGNEAIPAQRPAPVDYVPAPGECFVPPQGDPLYDEHYAGINEKNCGAFKEQSEAFYVDAQTESVQVETSGSRVVLYGFVIFVLAVIGFFAWAIFR